MEPSLQTGDLTAYPKAVIGEHRLLFIVRNGVMTIKTIKDERLELLRKIKRLTAFAVRMLLPLDVICLAIVVGCCSRL